MRKPTTPARQRRLAIQCHQDLLALIQPNPPLANPFVPQSSLPEYKPSDWRAPANPGPRAGGPECAQSSAAFAVNQPVTVTPARLWAGRPFRFSPRVTKTACAVVLGICRGGKGPPARASGRERVSRQGEGGRGLFPPGLFIPNSEIKMAGMRQAVGAETVWKNRRHTRRGLVRFFQTV